MISAFTNNGIDPDYRVPTGRIVSFDKNKDTYDVELDNPNDVPINSTATLVAVSRDATEFLLDEADATGTLDEEIAPHERGYLAVDAFYDPNIRVDMDEIMVYAIDTDYYYEAR